MIRIALVGDIGSGKTFISNLFKYPVFNADLVVSNLYKKDKFLFRKIKKRFPNKVRNFPLKKEELLKIIFQNKKNLNVLGKLIHPKVRKKMNDFLKVNQKKKFVVLDVPLLLENKLNTKRDIIIFIENIINVILHPFSQTLTCMNVIKSNIHCSFGNFWNYIHCWITYVNCSDLHRSR